MWHIGAEPSGQRAPAPWAMAPRVEAWILHCRHQPQGASSGRSSPSVVVLGQLALRGSASEVMRARGDPVASGRQMLVRQCVVVVRRCTRQGGARRRHPRRLPASQMQIGVGIRVKHYQLLRPSTACAALLRRQRRPLPRQRAMVTTQGAAAAARSLVVSPEWSSELAWAGDSLIAERLRSVYGACMGAVCTSGSSQG